MSRALITGAAGFIGCHVLERHPHFSYVLGTVMNRSLMLERVIVYERERGT